jgi:hypothetical protein
MYALDSQAAVGGMQLHPPPGPGHALDAPQAPLNHRVVGVSTGTSARAMLQPTRRVRAATEPSP